MATVSTSELDDWAGKSESYREDVRERMNALCEAWRDATGEGREMASHLLDEEAADTLRAIAGDPLNPGE